MQRAKETSVSTSSRAATSASSTRAAADAVWPRKGLNLLRHVVGCRARAGLTFFFEYLDSRLKTPDEVKAHLGLPALGLVPVLAPKSWKGKEPLIHVGVPRVSPRPSGRFAPTCCSRRQKRDRGPGDYQHRAGRRKTTVASNLAIGFAQAGQRVLLIDADMRRPRVHEVFGRRQEPGLSNVMVGNAKASQSVHKTGVPGLWHGSPATCRRTRRNCWLSALPRFRDVSEGHFDLILIDSPPVMAVTDAVIAAHAANGVVFVVGSEMTSRQAARAAVEHLEQGRVHFVGAILNRVDLERNSYYYSNYYRHEYGSYYQRAVNAR